MHAWHAVLQVAAACKQLGAKEVDTIASNLAKTECVEQLATKALSHGSVFVSHLTDFALILVM